VSGLDGPFQRYNLNINIYAAMNGRKVEEANRDESLGRPMSLMATENIATEYISIGT